MKTIDLIPVSSDTLKTFSKEALATINMMDTMLVLLMKQRNSLCEYKTEIDAFDKELVDSVYSRPSQQN